MNRIMQRLTRAELRYKDAERELHDLMRLAYPVGSNISWNRGLGSPHHGVVISWGYRDRIKVLNRRTGIVRWITFCQIDAPERKGSAT